MEKTSNNLLNLSNLPTEIQQHIASYLDGPSLGFFALSDKQRLKNVLPLLRQYQASFPLQLTAKGHSTYLTQANQLFVCGSNEYGQLGLGNKGDCATTFTAVPWPEDRGKIQQVITGGNHPLVLTKNKKLWVCGANYSSQLGLGDNEHRATFTAVPWPDERGKIRQVIAGKNHTLVLTQTNRLWGCGDNLFGQLGLGDKANRANFTAVLWPEDRGRIKRVIAGSNHTGVLTHDNQLWGCGNNGDGQLGLGDREHRSTFTVVPWPAEQGRIQQVITGEHHTVVLTEDNRLWGCGNNASGQLGLGDWQPRSTFTIVPWPKERGRIEQVIAGLSHTVVLTDANRLWVCGDNGYGQLGLGDKAHCLTFTAVPWPTERGKIHQVIAGVNHTVVLTGDNQLWGCGYNASGQLGLGDQVNRTTFTLVKSLSEAMQQVFTLNNSLNQLIKLGTALIPTPSIKSDTFHSQCQLDEPDGQPPVNKMKL